MTLGTGNQRHCDITEMQTARQFLELLQQAGVKATFFISGKAFEEEWEDVLPISESPLVEVGGHNYSCFEPELWHRAWKKINGSYNGPAWFQKRDAQKTIDIIRRKTGRTIQCWRNHMYMHGPFTEKVLSECGIKICSDGVSAAANGPVLHPSGILNLPINVIPDHEHLYHAERTPEWVDWWINRYNWSDDFGPRSYPIEEWTGIVLDQLRRHERDGVLSNMIIHPITMYLCDRFKSFQKILEYLASCRTIHMSELTKL
jgi:peptidoglycan/xylan/chitin deacetylase (PgdA/CDA1 family)